MKRTNLFPLNKMGYIKDKDYRKTNCILCQILEKNSNIKNLLIFQGKLACVTLNLYPYNPGHLMIFPYRHILDIRSLTTDEEQAISLLTKTALNILEKIYFAGGFNIGYNIGESSGASIAHLHLHIVPRYPNELGFIDILSGSKLIIEDPEQTKEKLHQLFHDQLAHTEIAL